MLRGLAWFRRLFQASQLWFIVLAACIGAIAGLCVALLSRGALNLQQFLYGFSENSNLSTAQNLEWWRFLALPLGGITLGLIRHFLPKRKREPIDVIEANALYGGRIPLRDSLLVSLQTLVSNGFGASVGLEAAFAQMGGGVASRIGQWLNMRRSSLRTLVGAGAGGAIGAAFGAPLAGSFYAFEIVLGGYTPANLAPVAVASLCAVIAAQMAGQVPFVAVSTIGNDIAWGGYALYVVLGLICALVGIGIVRLVAIAEGQVRRSVIPEPWRPVIGGILLMGLGLLSVQTLSSGHGAMHLDMAQSLAIGVLLWIFVLKLSACVVSLGFGFRGGLFFASLFLGSLLGAAYAQIINSIAGMPQLDVTNTALVGMAALAAAIVGGPMTMSLMILEVTHDFALTAAVVTAALCASALVRAKFGYSFSTWRLHLRGEAIRNARDIGWVKTITAQNLMRTVQEIARETMTILDLREKVALGSNSRVMLVDEEGHYKGILPTADAYIDGLDLAIEVRHLAIQQSVFATPELDIMALITLFDDFGADDLAVVDAHGKLMGLLTEKYVRRRYVEELERAHREFFGEV